MGKMKQKILVFGAGVIGSLYAAKLKEAGHDVSVVARGQRYEDLKNHGIVLEFFDSGERLTEEVKVFERMPADDYFDFCLVPVQKTQLEEALDALSVNSKIPAFLFMVNNAEGPEVMVDALGRERVLLGFANAGGEREGHLVRLMVAKGKAVTMGEIDGSKSSRILKIASAFRQAGIKVEISRNMDAWLRYHVALVGPMANAIYMAGGCNYELARKPEIIRKGLQAQREAMGVLRTNGFPVEPSALRVLTAIPDFILTPLAQRLIGTKLMDIGGKRHALNAREEMIKLNEELLTLARKSGIDTPTMEELHIYSDPGVPQ